MISSATDISVPSPRKNSSRDPNKERFTLRVKSTFRKRDTLHCIYFPASFSLMFTTISNLAANPFFFNLNSIARRNTYLHNTYYLVNFFHLRKYLIYRFFFLAYTRIIRGVFIPGGIKATLFRSFACKSPREKAASRFVARVVRACNRNFHRVTHCNVTRTTGVVLASSSSDTFGPA